MPMHSPMHHKDMHVFMSPCLYGARVHFIHAPFLLLACMTVQIQQRVFKLKALLRAAMRSRDPDDEFGRCRLEASLEEVLGSAAVVKELLANRKIIPYLIEPDLRVSVHSITMHLRRSTNTPVCAEDYHLLLSSRYAFHGKGPF